MYKLRISSLFCSTGPARPIPTTPPFNPRIPTNYRFRRDIENVLQTDEEGKLWSSGEPILIKDLHTKNSPWLCQFSVSRTIRPVVKILYPRICRNGNSSRQDSSAVLGSHTSAAIESWSSAGTTQGFFLTCATGRTSLQTNLIIILGLPF